MSDVDAEDRLIKDRYFVEECDLFSSIHLGHEILGWFDDLDQVKQFANQRAADVDWFCTYRIHEPKQMLTFLN
jgi:hypothetical protein